MSKLKQDQLHLLRLAGKNPGVAPDLWGGWVHVSDTVWPLVQKLPGDLVILMDANGLKSVKLTEGGLAVVKYTKVVR